MQMRHLSALAPAFHLVLVWRRQNPDLTPRTIMSQVAVRPCVTVWLFILTVLTRPVWYSRLEQCSSSSLMLMESCRCVSWLVIYVRAPTRKFVTVKRIANISTGILERYWFSIMTIIWHYFPNEATKMSSVNCSLVIYLYLLACQLSSGSDRVKLRVNQLKRS